MKVFHIVALLAALHSMPGLAQADPTGMQGSMYTESTAQGRVVGPTDSVALCALDDEGAARDMENMAVAAYLPKTRVLPICTEPTHADWRVVRKVADRCLMPPGAEWCEVEAHAVLVEREGRRRYAVILVTAAQLD